MNDGSLPDTANFLDSTKSEKACFLNLKYSTQFLSIDPKNSESAQLAFKNYRKIINN